MHHCTVKALGLLALLFLVSSRVHAQTHPCGAGPGPNEVQVGENPGGNGVAPTPMCNWVNGNQSQNPQQPPLRWADQWGAIATDFTRGSVGIAANTSDQHEAERSAIADCQAKGGSLCSVEIAYKNECAALVAGNTGHNTKAGATVAKATQAAMKICNAADASCKAYFSTCSLPKPSL